MRVMDFYGTLGPAACSQQVLRDLFLKGMTGVRLNLSHSNLEDCKEWIEALDSAAKSLHIQRKLLIDLQGPELRIGVLEKTLPLENQSQICFIENGSHTNQGADLSLPRIPVAKQVLWNLKPMDFVLLDDGKLLAEISALVSMDGTRKEDCDAEYEPGDVIVATVLRGGQLSSRKSIAIQGKSVELPTLTASDIKNIGMAKKYGVTGVMLPFVRNRQDLVNVRKVLIEAGCQDVALLAKIENQQGVDQIEDLIPACDEIVIARGDLGNSVGLIHLPSVQEKLAITCRQHKRRFMVVTQMLASMEHNPVPTRAEVMDIYTAVRMGAGSVMLTGEIAVGEYPVASMEVLVETAKTGLTE